MKKRVVLNSPRLKELRRKKHKSTRTRLVVFVVLFLFIFSIISLLSRVSKFNIDNITISGNKITDTNDIETVVKNIISGNYLFIFPKTNFLIYPKQKIITGLNYKFKRLNNISINVNNFRTLEITVSEYGGKYLWCGGLIPTSENKDNKCYFLDSNGYIFDEAPYFSGNVYFKFYGDSNLNKENPSGSYFLKDKWKDVIEFKNTIEKLDLKVTSFWVDEKKEEGNFAISGEPETSPKIIFKINDDYEKLAENLQAAISIEPLKTDLKTKLSTLLYIDLRFGNKVYYKFQ